MLREVSFAANCITSSFFERFRATLGAERQNFGTASLECSPSDLTTYEHIQLMALSDRHSPYGGLTIGKMAYTFFVRTKIVVACQ